MRTGPVLEAGSSRRPAGDLARLPTEPRRLERTTVAGQHRIHTGFAAGKQTLGTYDRPLDDVKQAAP